MKKILFLFLMVMGLMSSLYALDTSQGAGCDAQMSQTLSEIDGVKTTPSDVTFVKVNILHKDTLIYSWGESGDNKMKKFRLASSASLQTHTYGSKGQFEVGWQDTLKI